LDRPTLHRIRIRSLIDPRWLAIAAALVVLLSLVAPASADSLSENVAVPAQGLLRVSLEFGTVRIAAHEEAAVRIEARARGIGASGFHFEWIEPEIAGEAHLLLGRADAWLERMGGGPRVDVVAWVPAGFSVEVETSDGDVEVVSVASVVARTEGASIAVDQVRGSVDVATEPGRAGSDGFERSGRVEVSRVCGDVHARTRGARISLTSIGGRVDADAGRGPIEVDGLIAATSRWVSKGSSRARSAWCPVSASEVAHHFPPSLGPEAGAGL
jgi:hypothetical protein